MVLKTNGGHPFLVAEFPNEREALAFLDKHVDDLDKLEEALLDESMVWEETRGTPYQLSEEHVMELVNEFPSLDAEEIANVYLRMSGLPPRGVRINPVPSVQHLPEGEDRALPGLREMIRANRQAVRRGDTEERED